MSRWRSERARPRGVRLEIGLDQDSLVWTLGGAPAPASSPHRIAWPPAADAESTEGIHELQVQMAQARSIWVVISHRCAEHWLQTPPAGIPSLGELRRVANARSRLLWGWPADQTLVAALWDAEHPFPCIAVPSALTSPLLALMGRHAARSCWSSAWAVHQAGLRPDRNATPHALQSPARISLWQQTGKKIDALLTLPLQPDTSPAELAGAMRSFVRELGSTDTGPWLALCTTAPIAEDEAGVALELARSFTPGAPAPLLPLGWAQDGHAARRPGHRWRQAAAAVSLLVLAASGPNAWRALEPVPPAQAGASTEAKPPRNQTRWREAERRGLQDLADQLQTPWGVLLDQVANSLPLDVRLQHFEPDAKQLRLRLVTESTSSTALLRHAQSLSALSSVAGVRLESHAPSTGVGSGPPQLVRLQMDLTLRPLPW